MMYYVGFFATASLYGVLRLVSSLAKPVAEPTVSAAKTEEFKKFQMIYLTAYYMAVFADWLKGPYVYALYEDYGYEIGDIAILFIAGYGSSMIFGTIVGALSDVLGRKAMCIAFCVFYSIGAVSALVNQFAVLFVGRLVSGVATSLLFSSFEAWMVCEHNKHGFPQSLLSNTFRLSTLGNGALAVMAGLCASWVAETYGYAAPFVLALVPLLALGIFISFFWTENYGNSELAVSNMLQTAVRTMLSQRKLLLLGASQSLFEGGMYTWIFMWTPALKTSGPSKIHEHHGKADLPYGVIFASFMVCVMIGSDAMSIGMRLATPEKLSVFIHVIACISMAVASMFLTSKMLIYICFLAFEFSVGMFYPVYGVLRSIHVPEETRAAIMNCVRVPLNLFVVLFLMKAGTMSVSTVFFICAVAQLGGVVCIAMFAKEAKIGPAQT